jgi:MYXO-CTERM domain-containing protein
MSLRPFHADGGGGDTFVARIASDGGGVLDFAYLGGSGVDFPWEMALDPTGNLYVVGQTSSTDFPVSAGAVQTSNASGENLNQDGPFDAFVTELSPEGAILYSTYLGGEGDDRAFGVALDSAGHVHLAGMTTSVGVERYVKDPLRGEHDQTLGFDVLPDGGGAFFLADLSLDGGLDFFSFFGAYGPGLPLPYGNTLAIDAADNLYFTGYVFQDGFPVTSGAFQAHDQVPVGLGTIVVSKIIPTPLPATLTAVQPTTGRAGTNVDVYGTNLGPQCQLTFGEVVEPVSGASTTELVTQLVPTSDCGPVDVSVACVGSPIFVLPGGFTYIGCDGGGGGGTDGGESRTDGGTDGGTGSGSSGCSSSAASAPDGILFALVVLAAAGRPGRQRKHP